MYCRSSFLIYIYILCLFLGIRDDNFIVAVAAAGVYLSTNGGSIWSLISSGLTYTSSDTFPGLTFQNSQASVTGTGAGIN